MLSSPAPYDKVGRLGGKYQHHKDNHQHHVLGRAEEAVLEEV